MDAEGTWSYTFPWDIPVGPVYLHVDRQGSVGGESISTSMRRRVTPMATITGVFRKVGRYIDAGGAGNDKTPGLPGVFSLWAILGSNQ